MGKGITRQQDEEFAKMGSSSVIAALRNEIRKTTTVPLCTVEGYVRW
jgi:hypothetical protein